MMGTQGIGLLGKDLLARGLLGQMGLLERHLLGLILLGKVQWGRVGEGGGLRATVKSYVVPAAGAAGSHLGYALGVGVGEGGVLLLKKVLLEVLLGLGGTGVLGSVELVGDSGRICVRSCGACSGRPSITRSLVS
jgi:hypothetical protein